MVIPTVSKTKVAASKATATASTLKKVATAPTKSKLREVATPQSPSPASARSISISETGKSPLSRRSASVPPSMHGDPIREMANTTGEAFSAATQAFLNQQREFAQPVSSRATASLRTSPFPANRASTPPPVPTQQYAPSTTSAIYGDVLPPDVFASDGSLPATQSGQPPTDASTMNAPFFGSPPITDHAAPELGQLRRNVKALYEDARSHILLERNAIGVVHELRGQVQELQKAFRQLAEVAIEEIEGLRADVDRQAAEIDELTRGERRVRALETQVARLTQWHSLREGDSAELSRLAQAERAREKREALWEDDRRELKDAAEFDRASLQKAVRTLNASTAAVEERQAHTDALMEATRESVSQLSARQQVLNDEVGILADAFHEATLGGGGVLLPPRQPPPPHFSGLPGRGRTGTPPQSQHAAKMEMPFAEPVARRSAAVAPPTPAARLNTTPVGGLASKLMARYGEQAED